MVNTDEPSTVLCRHGKWS